jgi:hypothetical protein
MLLLTLIVLLSESVTCAFHCAAWGPTPLVYELRSIAQGRIRSENAGLRAGDILVHNAWMRLAGNSPSEFLLLRA